MAGAPTRRFEFDGRAREASGAEPLARTLSADGVPVLQRSIRYHRPRAPFCGIGYCTGCLVRVDGAPNVRACRYVPAPGDHVRTENAWPSPRFDVMGALDFLFPGGVDTLRGFRRPAAFTGVYQRVVRRLAGYGAPPTPGPDRAPPAPPVTVRVDVGIVGGGASGRAAAAKLRAAGRNVLVIDRSLEPPAGAPDVPRLGGTVTFLPPRSGPRDPFVLLGFSEPGRGIRVTASQVVLAPGGYDGSLLFEGNDRPGILTADAAFALARGPDHPPFRRAIVVGGGARAGAVLRAFGHRVEAVVAPLAIAPEVVRSASELEVPLYPRTLLESASGRARVRRLRLRSRGKGTRFDLDCDAVVLAHRRLPSAQLFFQAGARMEWHADPGAYYPRVTAEGATTVDGLYAAGSAAGAAGGEAAASGARAAEALLRGASPAAAGAASTPDRSELEGYYRELLTGRPGGRWIACACEDVLLDEIEAAHRAGYRGIEVIKRYTGVGTGLCQGRYCLPDALLVLALLEGRPPAEVGYITQRPPAVPTPLGALAAIGAESTDPGGP